MLNIQHEYGLFGGERGEWLIDLMRGFEKPVVVTLHTVLPDPDETMLRVTRDLVRERVARSSRSLETGRSCSKPSTASIPTFCK